MLTIRRFVNASKTSNVTYRIEASSKEEEEEESVTQTTSEPIPCAAL